MTMFPNRGLYLVAAVVGVLAAFVAGSHHGCIHDTIRTLPGYGDTAPTINASYAVDTTIVNGRRFQATQSNFASMRIRLFFDQGDCAAGTCGHCQNVGDTVPTYESASSRTTCQADDVLTTAKKAYMMDRLMPAAASFLASALNVVRVSGNLVVSGGSTCGSAPGTVVPPSHQTTGVADADFVVYVTAAPRTDRESATVAWAGACRQDSAGRPVVAHVNFIPGKLTNAGSLNAVQQADDESTAIHEISHALGFASPFFGSRGYLDADGVTMVQGGTLTVQSTSLGKTVTYLTSPRVKYEVRNYFGCSTLDGGEIEDQGGSGTAGSHWEKRVFADETMAGISSGVASYFSRATLAFFEDTGHYTANYGAASSRMTWGKSKGCTFATKKCNAQPSSSTLGSEFCFDTDQSNTYCTYDRLGRGYCGVGSYTSDIPTEFQYFSSARTGGVVLHSDFCPFVLPYSNRICIDTASYDDRDVYGTTYAADARCFDSTLRLHGEASSTRRQTRCFVPYCNGVQLLIKIKQTTVACPADGTGGEADLTPLNGAYDGQITCPVSSVFGCSSTAATTPPPGLTPAPTTPAPPGATSNPSSGPTPPSTTPAPTGVSGLYPTPAPDALAATCDERVACAQQTLATKMPQCRAVARRVQDCFGTNCDAKMEAFFRSVGITANCSSIQTRRAASDTCMEGLAGVADLCELATSPAVSRGASMSMLFFLLAVTFSAMCH